MDIDSPTDNGEAVKRTMMDININTDSYSYSCSYSHSHSRSPATCGEAMRRRTPQQQQQQEQQHPKKRQKSNGIGFFGRQQPHTRNGNVDWPSPSFGLLPTYITAIPPIPNLRDVDCIDFSVSEDEDIGNIDRRNGSEGALSLPTLTTSMSMPSSMLIRRSTSLSSDFWIRK